MDMLHGQAAWTIGYAARSPSMDMHAGQLHEYAARTCSMNIQHGNAAWTFNMDMKSGHSSSMDMQQRPAAWTRSMDMQHGHAARTWSMNMKQGNEAGTYGHVAWTYS
jgi:hypothetical protein